MPSPSSPVTLPVAVLSLQTAASPPLKPRGALCTHRDEICVSYHNITRLVEIWEAQLISGSCPWGAAGAAGATRHGSQYTAPSAGTRANRGPPGYTTQRNPYPLGIPKQETWSMAGQIFRISVNLFVCNRNDRLGGKEKKKEKDILHFLLISYLKNPKSYYTVLCFH